MFATTIKLMHLIFIYFFDTQKMKLNNEGNRFSYFPIFLVEGNRFPFVSVAPRTSAQLKKN